MAEELFEEALKALKAVWVVTTGEYSGYMIRCVYLTEEKAEARCKRENDKVQRAADQRDFHKGRVSGHEKWSCEEAPIGGDRHDLEDIGNDD